MYHYINIKNHTNRGEIIMMIHSKNNNKVYTLKEIVEISTPFFKEYDGITKVYIFDDYADGTANEESSIELVMETEDDFMFYDDYILSDILCKDCRINEFDSVQDFKKWATTMNGNKRPRKVIYERNK